MLKMLSLTRSLLQLARRSCFETEKNLRAFAIFSSSNSKCNSMDLAGSKSHGALLTLSVLATPSLVKRKAHVISQSLDSYNYNSTLTKLSSTTASTNIPKQKLLCRPLQLTSSTVHSSRNVIMIGYDGKKHNDQEAVDRFRRLGNGLWLRKQRGGVNIWKKFMVRRKPWKVFRSNQIVFCNKWQSKMLDKMTTDEFKKQKWYVDDLYKGYTEESFFYYHPKDLPWNTVEKPEDYFKYAVKRYRRGNHQRRFRRKKHSQVVDSYRQKPLPNTKNGFCFAR